LGGQSCEKKEKAKKRELKKEVAVNLQIELL